MDYETGKFLERIEAKQDIIITLLGYDPQTSQQPKSTPSTQTEATISEEQLAIDEEQLALDRETKENLRHQQEKIKAALNRRGIDDE